MAVYVDKTTGYVVVGAGTDQVSVRKSAGYVVTGAGTNQVGVGKVTGYVVIQSAGDTTLPLEEVEVTDYVPTISADLSTLPLESVGAIAYALGINEAPAASQLVRMEIDPVIGSLELLVGEPVVSAYVEIDSVIGSTAIVAASSGRDGRIALDVIGATRPLIRSYYSPFTTDCTWTSDGYLWSYNPALERTPMVSGVVRQRRRWTPYIDTVNASLECYAEDLPDVEAALESAGAGWWMTNLATGSGVGLFQVRLTETPITIEQLDGLTYRVTVELDVYPAELTP